MKIWIYCLVFCLVLLLPACGKKAIFVDSGFIGVWNGTDGVSTYHISIDNRSGGYFDKSTNGHFESAQGVARVNNNHLHIGLRHFTIDELPVSDSLTHRWTTILSGVTYTR